MKQILGISSVYIGLVIGAGFASGREIFEYFNIPSQTDFTGIILAGLCFSLLAYVTMSLSKAFFANTFDEFIEKVSPKAAPFVKLFMSAFMFCGYFVMLSASGTLFESTLSLPFGFGVLGLSIICFTVFAFDISGIIIINTFMVPIMILGMTILCISTIICGVPAFSVLDSLKNNFLISALCYVSYNTITAGAVLVPLARDASKQNLRRAAFLSGGVLGTLIFIVWLALNIYYSKLFSAEMPLLELAAFNGSVYKTIYSVVLFMALCTTAISHGFGLLSKFRFKGISDRIIAAAIFCLVTMPFAKLGFSVLIAKLYSIFGFIGLFWTGLVVFRYLKQG